MVSLMHGMISNKDTNIALESLQAVIEFANITLQTSSPTESVEVRLCTAQVLGHTSVTDVMIDLQVRLGAVHFLLWSVVIKLLQDEEPLIREQMVEAFSTWLNGIHNSALVSALTFGNFSVVPPLTLENAMFCVWFLYIEREPVQCILWMLKWIWGDMLCSCNPGQEDGISDVDRLFEKGPVNIYNEDLIVIDVTWKTVKTGIEVNNGYALLKLQRNRTEIIELLNKQLEECIFFLESLLLINYNVNKNLFSHFYRSFVGISVIIMLTEKLEGNISPMQSRIMAILHAVKKLSDLGGSLLHPKLQQPLKELCRFYI
ncbi:uncharacterized protein LOC110061611 [Orbicella faveolata]|uniref:uncharacterized protein LOC110061611 n=1 Tax=Orbicella faveolata TaxID=48498 RepID=UPI0009E499C2|nr:uncharacterized protein LOC110061611 [Orbicella faveolata]